MKHYAAKQMLAPKDNLEMIQNLDEVRIGT